MDSPFPRVLLVAPSPPPYGGMALQARLLERMLRFDGIPVTFLASNLEFSPALRKFDRTPVIRTVLRWFLLSVRLWAETRHADVVHVLACSWVYFFVVVWPAVLISRLRQKRVVLNYRGGEAARFFRWFGWAAWPVFRMASIVTAPSEFLSGVIQDRYAVRVMIVPNILNLSVFQYKRRAAFFPKMLVARHLEPMYDVACVLRAFGKVQALHPEASLLIAGNGPEEQSLKQLAANLRLRNVRFLGHVPQSDLPALHAECDILLNGSRVDNFPGALLEASASGLAIVSTGAGGIPFIYENRQTAMLVEPGDSDGLANAVEDLLSSPDLGASLTAAALELARGCDWNEVCKPLFKAYEFPPECHRERAVSVGAMQ